MVNIQDYIESGILEQYALGELSAAEQAAVEAFAAAHPEVLGELQQVQAALSFYAEAHIIATPVGMRERVLANVAAQLAAPVSVSSMLRADVDTLAHPHNNSHASASVFATQTVAAAQEAVVRSISSAPVAVSAASSGWAIAASVALLLSLGGNALFYSRWKDTRADLVALQNTQSRFATTTQVVEKQLGALRLENQVLRSDEFRAVALVGTAAAPSAHARVLFNPLTHKVYVDVKNLPVLPAGKQYQLWALDKGQPVDAGMLAVNTAVGADLQQMKDINSAQAFAVTVEPTGGSIAPTMPIQAKGAVSI